jgi:hypothetical protein
MKNTWPILVFISLLFFGDGLICYVIRVAYPCQHSGTLVSFAGNKLESRRYYYV